MRIAGWRHPVVVDLAGLAIPSQSRPIRFGHDATAGVGHTDNIRVSGGQLEATGVISRDTVAAREVVASSKNGFPWQASIGASVEEFEFVKDKQRVMVNGQEHAGPINVVRKSTLSEISFVDLGADGQTSASVAATADTEPTEIEKEVGMPTAEPETSPVIDATSTVEQIRAEAADELERIAGIRRLYAGQFPVLEAKAIREGWDLTKCELEKLREQRPKSPAIHASDKSINGRMLEAACLMAGRRRQR